MIQLKDITLTTFLRDYWQKKPLVIRQAIPDFINPLSPDELAGLALEDDMESRIVWETPNQNPQWHLKRGPFKKKDFTKLPKSHWTLLVQGVDRIIPEVYELLEHFNFLPQWRIDDVMISYAANQGSVGPHYDNYDVFLFQAQGKRLWSLTSKQCTAENYISDLELRIMKEFAIEEEFLLEEGDMLYLPPHIGHHGISQSDDCMTYSFGYRSYQGQELLDSLGDYLSEKELFKSLYQDPDWSELKHSSEISSGAWKNARKLIQQMLDNEDVMKSWFASFATRLDQSAEQHLPLPLERLPSLENFIKKLKACESVIRDASSRFAYLVDSNLCFINGCEWDTRDVSPVLIELLFNQRVISSEEIVTAMVSSADQFFLYELWKLQWIQLTAQIHSPY